MLEDVQLGLQLALLRLDLPDVDSAATELYREPTRIDTAKALEGLLDVALRVSEREGLPTGFKQTLQDTINGLADPLEPEGVYDRSINLSPWLPTSIPKLLEGAAKSTLSKQCAMAFVNYGVDMLPVLNAAVDGSDIALKETAEEMLKVLGKFVTRLEPVDASDTT